MLEQDLKDRVTFWANQLAPLGLSVWEWNIKIVDGDPHGHRSSAAAISPMEHYDAADLEFNRQALEESTPREVDGLIIHELLHAAMRDFEHAVELIESHIRNSSLWSMWDEARHHEREAFVERMTRTILALSSE